MFTSLWVTLWIDQETCIGCGYCIEACPEVFSWGAEKKAVVYNFEGCKICNCMEIIESCPVKAIVSEEESL